MYKNPTMQMWNVPGLFIEHLALPNFTCDPFTFLQKLQNTSPQIHAKTKVGEATQTAEPCRGTAGSSFLPWQVPCFLTQYFPSACRLAGCVPRWKLSGDGDLEEPARARRPLVFQNEITPGCCGWGYLVIAKTNLFVNACWASRRKDTTPLVSW